ncbi:MAG TPA: lipopolysaccharide heptosyltransferase II [bacterium]|nr:lipopolysaccharide heptosyltransferase II [bacterium]
MRQSLQSILFIQTAFLGDAILSTPLIGALSSRFPEASIDVVAIPQTEPVFRHHPDVRRVLVFDKRNPLLKPAMFLDLVRGIRGEAYTLGVSATRSATSALLMRLGKIPSRVGFRGQKGLTDPVRPPRGLHMRHRYLSLMRPFGGTSWPDQTVLSWAPEHDETAGRLLEDEKGCRFLVGVAPGSVRATKRWPGAYYTRLVALLESRGVRVVLLGSPEERGLCRRIASRAGTDSPVLAGRTGILEAAAVIRRLDLMITNDSAPLHMADAVKTPVFAFFGPTVRRFGCTPYRPDDRVLEIDLPCRPCSKHGGRVCPRFHFRCMREQTPDAVCDAVLQFLEKRHA